MRNLILVLSFLLFGTYAYAQDNPESRGPLEVRGYTIFQLSSFEFTTPLPTHLSENTYLFQHSATWTNIFNAPQGILASDYEVLRIDNRIWYGVTDRLSLGLSVPITAAGGGVMDTFIEGFHDTFGFSNNQRHKAPRNNFSADGVNYDSEVMISDVTLHARYRLFDNPGISVGLRLQSPSLAPTEWFNHHQVGVGIDITSFYEIDSDLGSFYFTAMASIARLGETTVFDYELTQYQSSLMVGLDWKTSNWLSVITQCVATSGYVNAYEYRKWSFEVAAGFRIYATDNSWVDIGATENLIHLENSADFGVHVGFTVRY